MLYGLKTAYHLCRLLINIINPDKSKIFYLFLNSFFYVYKLTSGQMDAGALTLDNVTNKEKVKAKTQDPELKN
jgi:hypothetical protein